MAVFLYLLQYSETDAKHTVILFRFIAAYSVLQ